MPQTTPAIDTSLRDQLAKLAAFEPQDLPVLSLYLNLAPDQHGRDSYDVFLRKAFAEHLKSMGEETAERASLERDIERINQYLADEVNRSSNGLALFASAGAGEFFEAIQLDAPMDEHWFVLGSVPHLYPLARVIDQYPRCAAVLLDTNRARILVFALGAVERREQVTGVKTRRTSMGGWSQARYQRRAENFHLHHVKEVVETLERIVRHDDIRHIIIAGDDVVVPLLRNQLPQQLAEKVVDVLKLNRHAGDDEIIEATLGALRQKDAETTPNASRGCSAPGRAEDSVSSVPRPCSARFSSARWTSCSSRRCRRTSRPFRASHLTPPRVPWPSTFRDQRLPTRSSCGSLTSS